MSMKVLQHSLKIYNTMRHNYHVTKTESGWEGRRENKNHAISRGSTKREVVSEMIKVAKHHQPSSLKIHKVDGSIQEERTYPRSSDPEIYRG